MYEGQALNRWLLLSEVIAGEVAGTMMLRASVEHGAWIPGVIAAYAVAFALLGLTMKTGVPVGVAYGIWGASGVTLVALLGTVLFDEHLSL